MKAFIRFSLLIIVLLTMNYNTAFTQIVNAASIVISSNQANNPTITLLTGSIKNTNNAVIKNEGTIIITDSIENNVSTYISNGLVNNSSLIQVKNGNFTLKDNSRINNDGTIELGDVTGISGSWINNSNNNVFENLNDKGNLRFSGKDNTIDKAQKISGKPTIFENLSIDNAGWKALNSSANGSIVKGKFEVNSKFDLASNTLIIDNRSNDAVSYGGDGFILSDPKDNSSNYGKIQWNIGDNSGDFAVPFGSNSASGSTDNSEGKNNLNVDLTIKTPGQPSDGKIVFGTYPTDNTNLPLPAGVLDLTGMSAPYIVDRYWMIDAQYNTKPVSQIKFNLGTNDYDSKDNSGMKVDNLLAVRYNTNLNTWLDIPASGSYSDNSITTNEISNQDFYKDWTMVVASKLTIPNVFIPGNDSSRFFILTKDPLTGQFKPEGKVQGISELHGSIFNRWGVLVYEWDNDNWWDGTYKGKGKGNEVEEGTYFYIITAKGVDGVVYKENKEYSGVKVMLKGSVSILRKN